MVIVIDVWISGQLSLFTASVSFCVIHTRGFNNLKAVLDDLLEKGMKNASEVILTGCSGWYSWPSRVGISLIF